VERADTTVTIPDKAYFKIGEVCELTGIKTHTLRYWETEFSIIKPKRAGSRQRLYRRADVENILLIKRLIHEDGLTIAGARKFLAKRRGAGATLSSPPPAAPVQPQLLQKIKQELIAIKEILQ